MGCKHVQWGVCSLNPGGRPLTACVEETHSALYDQSPSSKLSQDDAGLWLLARQHIETIIKETFLHWNMADKKRDYTI